MEYFSIDHLKSLADVYLIPFGINLLLSAVIFIVGRTAAQLIIKMMHRLFARAKVDESLSKFLTDLAYVLLMMIVIIAALERLGIKTTAAIAVIGAMGLAVGLALQGSLGNFASGVLLILFKPYRVGDLVKLSDYTGIVHSIKIFNTILVTLDNRQIIIPNGNITGNTIENISALGKLRMDLIFGISYTDDIPSAKEVMLEVLQAHPKILKDPAPTVAVAELADSSVNFAVRPWVDPNDYWDVFFDVTEAIKLALDANGISIPFPQRDVHLIQSEPKQAA